MKRHTNKHVKIFSGMVAALMVALGVEGFVNPSWAQSVTGSEQNGAMTGKTESGVPVEFELEPMASLSTPENLTISNLVPGTAQASNTADVTVTSNSAYGYTLTATSGASGELTMKDGGKFTQLEQKDSPETLLAEIPENQWGVAWSSNGDITSDSAKYSGLATGDGGANGTTLLTTDKMSGSNSTVKVQVGAKAGPALPTGTYEGTINFYVTTKDGGAPAA